MCKLGENLGRSLPFHGVSKIIESADASNISEDLASKQSYWKAQTTAHLGQTIVDDKIVIFLHPVCASANKALPRKRIFAKSERKTTIPAAQALLIPQAKHDAECSTHVQTLFASPLIKQRRCTELNDLRSASGLRNRLQVRQLKEDRTFVQGMEYLLRDQEILCQMQCSKRRVSWPGLELKTWPIASWIESLGGR